MKKRIALVLAATAAVTTPTATHAVNGTGGASDALDVIVLERIVLDMQAAELCTIIWDGLASGLDLATMVEVGVDEFAIGYGPDFPPEAAIYLAGILTGCGSA